LLRKLVPHLYQILKEFPAILNYGREVLYRGRNCIGQKGWPQELIQAYQVITYASFFGLFHAAEG